MDRRNGVEMVDLSKLNREQKAAVTAESPQLRIVAGAGSGKTKVLTTRIAYLIEDAGIDPSSILAITFTNKAAEEMKVRVKQLLKAECNRLWISTIHALCVRILRQDIHFLNYPRNFTIVDGDDQKTILKEAYRQIQIDKRILTYSRALDYIAANKAAYISPDKAKELAGNDDSERQKARVYAYYCERLRNNYALDFDDLILKTVELFRDYPAAAKYWGKRFLYVLVDEFQDIDRLQYRLIKYLTAVHKQLYVVGDPDQTIYTWRGADVRIIMDFNRDFPKAETIVLKQNYRSTNNILNAANSMIKHNKERVEKELYSLKGKGAKVCHYSLADDEAEAYYIQKEIAKLNRDGLAYQDIAVLYRSNYLSRNIEKALIELHIPYVLYGGIRFYERMEVKDVLAYLRMITTADDLAFKRIINTPKRAIGAKTLEDILKIAQENNLSMYETVKRGLYPRNKETLTAFVGMVEKWRTMLQEKDLDHLLAAVLEDSHYRQLLEKEGETERLENIKSLIDDIREYEVNYPDSNLDEYLQMIALYTDKNTTKLTEAVSLSTIHAAKGLEFDTVFVAGMSESIFPSEKTLAEGKRGLEEERRLAYVAYTRAKRLLYLTENSDFSFVLGKGKVPSRFIQEIDAEFIEHLPQKKKMTNVYTFTKANTSVKPSNYRKMDHVRHDIFGEGVVVANESGILTIAFAYPYGVKRILAGHPSIHKE